MKVKFMVLAGIMAVLLAFSGCVPAGVSSGSDPASGGPSTSAPADASGEITVVSREEGSGTRGAFVELLEILEKDASGNKVDRTVLSAIIANKTDVVLNQIVGNDKAIGYISAGSVNESVKALKLDGVEPTPENIKSGSYKLARPFNIVTTGEVSDLAKDFVAFILSAEGQEVVAKSYIPIDDAKPYEGKTLSGKLVVAGSSSVSPIMEKLIEAYNGVNPSVTIELQTTDSTSGIQSTVEGVCDIGMASRALKDSESAKVSAITIATDGIAIIVNTANPVSDITAEAAKQVFIGEITDWSDLA